MFEDEDDRPFINGETPERRKKLFRRHLLILHDTVVNKNNYSCNFEDPVDYVGLGLDDYLEIVKQPMDLRTMGEKIANGGYNSDPRQYIEDLELMVRNAEAYNGNNHIIAKEGRKLLNFAEKYLNMSFKAMGFCCANKLPYRPQKLACYAHPAYECEVGVDKPFVLIGEEYAVCFECFAGDDDEITIYTNQNDPTDHTSFVFNKKGNDFEPKEKNDQVLEPLVPCSSCGRRMHFACVNYVPQATARKPVPYVCFNCLPGKAPVRQPSQFRSCHLFHNKLSVFIQNRVRNLHAQLRLSLSPAEEAQLLPVRIRVMSTCDKEAVVRPQMSALYSETKLFPKSFPYRAKAVFAFQEQPDGSEVIFFGFHVHEYSHEAAPPNSRRIYLSYLDSVCFFQPVSVRTLTYQEIILSYFDYARQLGYRSISIWSCPPTDTDDYMFYAHPKEQKIKKGRKLKEWYERLLNKGLMTGRVRFFTDISRRAALNRMKCIIDLPYMAGDLWPQYIEDGITDVLTQLSQKKIQSAAESSDLLTPVKSTEDVEMLDASQVAADIPGKETPASTSTPPATEEVHTPKTPPEQSVHVLLNNHILKQMRSKIDVCFDVELCDPSEKPIEISDPDPELNCPLFDGRDPLLMLCRTEHLEFSNIRRASYTTHRIVQIAVNTQIVSTFSHFCDYKHYTDCKDDNCPLPECQRLRRKIAINSTLIEQMAKAALLHHSALCDGTGCTDGACHVLRRTKKAKLRQDLEKQ